MRTADRTQGIIDRLAGAENYDAIKWILQSGVTTNYTESVVDAKIKANCDFQGRAGLTAKVERVAVGKTCKWCEDVAGEYVYPNVPADVWRRHDNCNCIIKYTAATGREDTLRGSGSTWFITESTDPEAIKKRRNFIGVITEPKPAQAVANATNTVSSGAQAAGVPKRKVEKNAGPLSEQEIIDKIAGGDNTQGSCASAALTYVGNKGGYDVRDFRGGKSQKYFSQNSTIKGLAELPNVDSWVITAADDFWGAEEVMKNAEVGKEYILATGSHAAIIKKDASGVFRYLELQNPDPAGNGWQLFTTSTLRDRFHCTKPFPGLMNPPQFPNTLIDVDTLSKADELEDILQYTNTTEKAQKKGAGGGIK